jgi:PLP dependent protein
MTMISDNLQRVRERIATACRDARRDANEVRLLAVSKTFGADAVAAAFAAGQTAFGENYVQEGVEKIAALRHLPIEWHMIGPIQSNKTRLVAGHFDWVHSVDRLKTAQRLSEQRPAHLPPLQVCLQVNVDGGPNKAGVPPDAAPALAGQVVRLPHLQLRGLMCIPEPAPDFIAACAVYTRAKALFDHLNAANLPFLTPQDAARFDTLSMGMTADLEAAIHSGSTLVRVGTAIFGVRPPTPESKG